MATLYEKYISGDDSQFACAFMKAQTFTPSTNHTITSVKLKLYKAGSPGTATVAIYATSGGEPVEPALCSGTYDGDTLGGSPGAWVEITLGAGAALIASTQYAVTIVGGDTSSNILWWRKDQTSPTYTGGQMWAADDNEGGFPTSWTSQLTNDAMFEEWGTTAGGTSPPTVTTQECTGVTAYAALGHGTITDIGGSSVTQHGHCWATTANPDTSDSKTTLGAVAQTGQFESLISSLSPGVLYYVRAYATNPWGTGYGSDVTITTATTIGRRYIWLERKGFHWWDEYGAERYTEGTPEASGLPWWWYT